MYAGEWLTLCKHGAYMLFACGCILYFLGHVVYHGCDTPIETFVVHSPNIGQARYGYEGRQALFLIFLSNIPYV
jgi:uncharacterized membrane protein YhhN